jgi:hypothetical protein
MPILTPFKHLHSYARVSVVINTTSKRLIAYAPKNASADAPEPVGGNILVAMAYRWRTLVRRQ